MRIDEITEGFLDRFRKARGLAYRKAIYHGFSGNIYSYDDIELLAKISRIADEAKNLYQAYRDGLRLNSEYHDAHQSGADRHGIAELFQEKLKKLLGSYGLISENNTKMNWAKANLSKRPDRVRHLWKPKKKYQPVTMVPDEVRQRLLARQPALSIAAEAEIIDFPMQRVRKSPRQLAQVEPESDFHYAAQGDPDYEELDPHGEFGQYDEVQIRHDYHGWYLCTAEEAAHEDEGHSSVGFDGRQHYANLAQARYAAALFKQSLA